MRRARASYELFLIIVVVALTVLTASGIYQVRLQVKNSKLLINELQMLRSAISLYHVVNKSYPQELGDLLSEEYSLENEEMGAYLKQMPPTKQGLVIDPFGNPYYYDKQSGWVSTSSQGYTNW